MRVPFVVSFCVCFMVGGAAPLRAEENKQQEDLIRSIVEAWRTRQEQVKTVTCSTEVDTFYPMGYLSDQKYATQKVEEPVTKVLPEQDQRFVKEKASWAIDFAAQRVRKEFQLTDAYVDENTRVFYSDYQLHLFTDGQYTLFSPKEGLPPYNGNQPVVKSDVIQYENASHQFLFSFYDLPLLWLGGGVNGKLPLPLYMQLLEGADRFSYRGEAQHEGHECLILTVQEQQSSSCVREFWIGREKPYPILYCRARDGDMVYWQNEIEYKDQAGLTVPAQWIYTEYDTHGKSFFRRTFVVREIQLNTPLSADLFVKRLEPGQIVSNVEKKADFEVDRGGALVPLALAQSKNYTLQIVLWNVLAIAVVGAAIVAWRFYRKRVKRR